MTTYTHVTAPTQFLDAKGVRYAYRRFGSETGTPLVFLHGEQNGDLMRDPDVTMGVDRETGTAEPLTYQNDYIGRYWEVYKDFVDGKPTKYYPAMKKDLAAMVTAWAKNIKAQGFDPAIHA